MIYKVICMNGYSYQEQVVKTFNSVNDALAFMDKEQRENPAHTYYLEEQEACSNDNQED